LPNYLNRSLRRYANGGSKKNVYNMEVIIDKYYYDPQLHDDDLPEGTNNTWVQEDIFRCEVLAESREIAESILEEKLDEIRPKLNKKLLVDIWIYYLSCNFDCSS
jgi:hypothetical protein